MQKISLHTSIFLMIISAACTSKSKYTKAADEIFDNIPNSTTVNLNAGKKSYNLYVPKGWTTEHRTYRGVNLYYLLAPQTKADPNTSINVLTEYMQNLDLNTFKAKTIESVKNAIPSASILAEGDIYANGLHGGWYSYTMEPAGVKASIIAYIFPKDGVAYTMTAGTQPEDAFRYRSIFDSVARSLKFGE